MKRENRMGWCWYDIHSLIWIYRQLYFIICIYIRGIKSSGMLGMVSVETNPSVYIDFSWQLYFNVCIYKGYKVKWIADDGVLWKYPICLYRTWLATLLYYLLYIRGIKSSDAKGMGWWGGRSFLLLTAKIVSICADEVGTNHPIFSFFR